MDNQKKIPNRLINEKSPYLLQHARNPVDWYPWGEEAFAKAKAEDKPVFLSIGYSTCHWCHVMAHESFEDEEAAVLLNRHFVCIKVDKEERPDIDAVYMAVCTALTGHGGWPLTLLLTPDKKPFFAGTYFPRHGRGGMAGLVELVQTVARQWRDNREALLEAGEQIASSVSLYPQQGKVNRQPDLSLADRAARELQNGFDKRYGGFSAAPKFPMPHGVIFLLRRHALTGDATALGMAEATLRGMYRGGIFDHIGGGFSRYSTDEQWLAPHFEKMLYDNALLAYAYLEAWETTEKPLYRDVAEQTLAYVLREMTAPEGFFYCAQDADSEGKEGKYYLLSRDEVIEALGEQDGGAFCLRYGVTERGNFEGKNIPNLIENEGYEQAAGGGDEAARRRLYEYRRGRMALHTDDKLLVSWNALMIAALARAHQALGNQEYLHAAEQAANFILQTLADDDGGLRVGWRGGQAFGPGNLDDYAFFAWAALELYRATFEVTWLERAAAFAQEMLKRFWDEDRGGFYLSAAESGTPLFRPREVYDGAMPSGNSVAAYVLSRLYRLTGDEKWGGPAERQLRFCASQASDFPSGHCFFLLALMDALMPGRELVCVTDSSPESVAEALRGGYHPDLAVLGKTGVNGRRLAAIAPFTADYPPAAHGTACYLCRGRVCEAPFDGLEQLRQKLKDQ